MRTDSSPGTLPAREHLPAGDAGTPVLDVVIPVYNEEKDLQPCVLQTARAPHAHVPVRVPHHHRGQRVDGHHSPGGARGWTAEIPEVTAFRLEQKGRGRALRTVWSASDAPVLAYMDVDLSTDLNALLPLVAPLISGHSDLAIGSRLARSSRVVRGPKREFISRAYNLILRGSLQARFSDAQCGFKAIRRDVAQRAAAARRGHRLVLRHRDAGARRARGAAYPRGAGRLGRRPRLHRAHREDGDRGPQGGVAGGQGPGDRLAAAGPAHPAVRRRPARPRDPGRAQGTGPPARRVLCRRRSVHPVLPAALQRLPASSAAPRSPTRWRCWSPRSPTPPPTGG